MEIFKGNTLLDRSFQASITIKGIDGLLEIVGAFLFLTATPTRVNSLIDFFTFHALSRNPNAFLASHLLHASQAITAHAHYFIFLYLLSHGLAKVVLVVALWCNRMWAYPAMIILLALFILYQLYRMTFAPTAFLAVLTIFDAAVIWLTVEEYKKQKMKRTIKTEARYYQ
ncbi:MAG: DUF2127 domain-containing protein [Candidatus Acidiferrales bacterium]